MAACAFFRFPEGEYTSVTVCARWAQIAPVENDAGESSGVVSDPQRSLLPAHLPAGRRFGGQPPAVRAALRPEMCGQFLPFLKGVANSKIFEKGRSDMGKSPEFQGKPQAFLTPKWAVFAIIQKNTKFSL